MGFRTVEFGPQGAEASVLWLFGPAVGLLIGSLIALFAVMALESVGLKEKPLFAWAFEK
jgi:ABC-type antimicrobial peptide transport system permease subunit